LKINVFGAQVQAKAFIGVEKSTPPHPRTAEDGQKNIARLIQPGD